MPADLLALEGEWGRAYRNLDSFRAQGTLGTMIVEGFGFRENRNHDSELYWGLGGNLLRTLSTSKLRLRQQYGLDSQLRAHS